MDNLPELRDIHIPSEVSIFPLAYGFWVLLLCLVLGFIIYKMVVSFIKSSRKRYAKNLLKNIDTQNVISASCEVSNLLRRICVHKFPDAKSLSGKDWLEFLLKTSKITLTEKSAELLLNAPYIQKDSEKFDEKNLKSLMMFANNWIGENL